jgi:hypothetical protein
MLAELNMFVHNEHLREGKVKERVKTHILGQRREPTAQATTANTMDIDSDNHDDSANNEAPLSNQILPQACAPASEIADHLCAMADADDDDEVELDGEAVGFPSELSVPLAELFDFENNYWVEIQERVGYMGLDEEMELYQLLDLDANGEMEDGEGMDEQGTSILL